MSSPYPPGPANGLFGLGSLRRIQRDVLQFSLDLHRQYGDAASFRIGPIRFFQFTHPQVAGDVLVHLAKKMAKPRQLKRVFGKWDGQGLILADGPLWVRQRRLVQKAFHPHRLQAYGAGMAGQIAKHVGRWNVGQTFNVAEEAAALTLDVVTEALFGTDVSGRARRISAAVQVLQEKAMRELSEIVPIPEWAPLPSKFRDRREIRMLNGLIGQFIDERRKNPLANDDLLSTLLAAVDSEGDGQGMSDQQARDEIMTLFLAGHETTAVTLTWTLYLLARHPEAQRRLADEVAAVLADRQPTLEDLPQLAYCQQVIKESMRLYPAVYFTSREAAEDCEIAGYRVPRGSQVHLLPYVMHRDQRWWEEPEAFRPERFAPNKEDGLTEYAYLPFGAGPRACIGRGFAMQELMLAVANVVGRFSVHLASGQGEPEMEAQVSLHPRGGVRLRLESRA